MLLNHDVTKKDDQKIAVKRYSIFSFRYYFSPAVQHIAYNKLTSSQKVIQGAMMCIVAK